MRRIKHIWQALFLTRRFFVLLAGLGALFLVSYFVPVLQSVARIGLWAIALMTAIDVWVLFDVNDGLRGSRRTPERLSNGDENPIGISMASRYTFSIGAEIIDELPVQLQSRERGVHQAVPAGGRLDFEYVIRPVERGIYGFGRLNVFVSSPLGLAQRRYLLADEIDVPVYPSFLQMRQYELMAASHRLHEMGVKRIRRIGQAMEFEQIRDYVPGDDPRRVNWPATARRGELMVNQYQDERAQPVYCLIDMGRVMKMSFEALSLLDYSINASLVLADASLNRQDRAGLLTFSHEMGSFVRAEKGVRQLGVLMDNLFALTTDFKESDFEMLYANVRRRIPQRSLLILFTNFESRTALARQLMYLRGLNRIHLLVVVFFENTELYALRERRPADTEAIYVRTIAEQFITEKEEIVRELSRYGIQTILSTPQQLSVNALNKYLEIKARGLF